MKSLPNNLAALLAGAAALLAGAQAHAASCCGGGGSTSLVLPKFRQEMVGLTAEWEHYDGLWHQDGHWVPDPPGSDLNQYRTTFGYAYRFADRWQGSVNVPYVWNSNHYSGLSRNTSGLGDMTLSLLYETFDNITCVYKVDSWEDLKPAVYFGAALTVPTGVSPYDDVRDNFDITGRGFYRLDGTVLIEKTVYPWNVGLQFTYGHHLARSINEEYGNWVAPYRKQLGDRASGSFSVGYTWFTRKYATWTATVAYADLWEDKATVDGATDPTTGLRKRSVTTTVAWANSDRTWVVKGSWGHTPHISQWGANFPTTDTFTLGLTRVLR